MSSIKISYVPVRYGYTTKKLSSSSTSIAYGYTSTTEESFNEQQVGVNAPATQAIVNNLPQWMELRKNRSSNGWKLVNSWGQNLESMVEMTKSLLQEQFLVTADSNQRSSLHSFSINDREQVEDKVFNNLLVNSSFSVRGPSRIGMPAGWARYSSSDDKSTYLVQDRPYICSGSMVIERNGIFGQSISLENALVKNISASCYFLANFPGSRAGLVVIAETIDGKALPVETTFNGQSQHWQRLTCSLPANNKIFRVHFVLYGYSTGFILFNAPKLEIADTAGRWCKSGQDGLLYTSSASNFSQICAVSG